MASALLLRLPFLNGTSLWLDEMWSIATARLPWPKMFWVILHQDSNASLYYLALHPWLNLGSSEFVVRSLSVLLGVLSIPLLYQLGNRLYGRPVGLVAALLLAVNKLHVSQSQDARGYALLIVLILLLSLRFLRCVEQPSAKNWAAYVVVGTLAVYAHVFAVLVLASHAVSLLFLPRREVRWKTVLACAVAILCLIAPLAYLLHARQHAAGAPLSWVGPVTFGALGRIFWSMAGGSHYGVAWALADGIVLMAAYGALSLVFVVWCSRQGRRYGRSVESWRAGFVLTWLVLPVIITTAVSFKAPVLIDKYLIVILPALAIAAAQALQMLRPKWSTAATVAMIGLGLLALIPYFQVRARNHEWQDVRRTIVSEARPGDAVVFMVAPGRLLYEYYGGEERAPSPPVLYPHFNADFRNDPGSLGYIPPLSNRSLDQWATQYRRLWVVLYHDEFWDTRPIAEQIERLFTAHYSQVQVRVFDGTPFFERAEVQLYSNDRAEADKPSQPASARAD